MDSLKLRSILENGGTKDNRLIAGIEKFINDEKFLLANDLNERTMSAKLAQYLQKEYCSDYFVDCEYNRMLDKNVNYADSAKRLPGNYDKTAPTTDLKGKTVYPDIIIHKERKRNNGNYIVIEVKKEVNNEDKTLDFSKLKKFTKIYSSPYSLNYEWGIYLEFNKEELSDVRLFKNGKQINPV
ncbi:MAG: hypothetical protein V1676_00315 [Candidatus Diapherotrites archaeon]